VVIKIFPLIIYVASAPPTVKVAIDATAAVCPVDLPETILSPPFAKGKTPVTPVVRGSPVAFVKTPLAGVPSKGVISVGDVAKTNSPLPVSFVTAAARFALEGVARNVAMPVPSPLTPVEIGRPVALVSTPLVGVPNSGVTSVGDVALTGEPEPVAAVHTGNADAPPPTSISVVSPAASVWCAPVAVVPAAMSPYAVVDVARPVPPCDTVTSVLLVSIVADELGRVKVLNVVAGPVNVRKFVPRTKVLTSDIRGLDKVSP